MKLKAPNEWKECKGIFVNGCIVRGEGSAFRARAHAHSFKGDEYFGWICFRSPKRIKGCYDLYTEMGDDGWDGKITKINQILLHEYAHLLAPNHYHDDTYRKALKDIGGHIEKRYRKVRR